MYNPTSIQVPDYTPDVSGLSVAILAGGLGTRLRSVLPDRQKVMAEVAGRPFLSTWFDFLEAHEFRNITLCTGHLGDQIFSAYGSQYGNIRLNYSVEFEPRGTGGALRLALPHLTSSVMLVLNGDSFLDFNLAQLLNSHYENSADISIVLTPMEDCSRYGKVIINQSHRVETFSEKNGFGPGWINAGIYLINRELLEQIPEGRQTSLERDSFPLWVKRQMYGWPCLERFIDIGTPTALTEAQSFFQGTGRMDAQHHVNTA